MTTCESDVILWLLILVAATLFWVGLGVWALHQQRANRLRLEILKDEQAAERAAMFAELDAARERQRAVKRPNPPPPSRPMPHSPFR